MSQKFFELITPRDMLDKAKREYKRMLNNIDVDSVFNFFVTVYHIVDYVEATGRFSYESPELKKMYGDKDLKNDNYYGDFVACRLICNSGKHLKISRDVKKYDIESINTEHSSSSAGQTMAGGTQFGEGDRYDIVVDGKREEVKELGTRLICKWEQFFADNGI